jgi:hypothetical protein
MARYIEVEDASPVVSQDKEAVQLSFVKTLCTRRINALAIRSMQRIPVRFSP